MTRYLVIVLDVLIVVITLSRNSYNIYAPSDVMSEVAEYEAEVRQRLKELKAEALLKFRPRPPTLNPADPSLLGSTQGTNAASGDKRPRLTSPVTESQKPYAKRCAIEDAHNSKPLQLNRPLVREADPLLLAPPTSKVTTSSEESSLTPFMHRFSLGGASKAAHTIPQMDSTSVVTSIDRPPPSLATAPSPPRYSSPPLVSPVIKVESVEQNEALPLEKIHTFKEEQPLPSPKFSGLVNVPFTSRNEIITVEVKNGTFVPLIAEAGTRYVVHQFPRSFVDAVFLQGYVSAIADYWVIKAGSTLGVFDSWSGACTHVTGVSGVSQKKTKTWLALQKFTNVVTPSENYGSLVAGFLWPTDKNK